MPVRFVFSFPGFRGPFVFFFICHCARTRAGVALSRNSLPPASAVAMVRCDKASAFCSALRVGDKTLKTRAEWMKDCSERTSHLSKVCSIVPTVRLFHPPSVGLSSSTRGCARLGSGAASPLGVVKEEVAVVIVLVRRHRRAVGGFFGFFISGIKRA